jgi:hypothetical protein
MDTAAREIAALCPASVLIPLSDANDLDAVVHALGIEDSNTTPAEAVEELQAEIERLRALTRDNAFLGYVIHGPLQPEQEARATKIERDALRVKVERMADKEYTREEMREACRNNYNAGLSAALIERAREIVKKMDDHTLSPSNSGDGRFRMYRVEEGREEAATLVRDLAAATYNAAASNFGRQLDAALPNADSHNDLAAKVAQLRADVAAMGNALADYFDNGSDYSTGAKVRAIAERQGAKNG